MIVVDALVGAVLFVEFQNFVVFANCGRPIVDVVFIKDNNGVALAAGDSSSDTYTHDYNRIKSCLLTGQRGDVDFAEAVGEDLVEEKIG